MAIEGRNYKSTAKAFVNGKWITLMDNNFGNSLQQLIPLSTKKERVEFVSGNGKKTKIKVKELHFYEEK